MNTYNNINIPEKSDIIIIPKTSPTSTKTTFFEKEYSLKENTFDPTKNSPPNFFMSKLHQRVAIYGSVNNLSIFNNE